MIWVEYQLTSPSFLAAAIKAASAAKTGPPASETTSAKMIVKVKRAMVSPLLCSFVVQLCCAAPDGALTATVSCSFTRSAGPATAREHSSEGDCDKTRGHRPGPQRGFSDNFTSI